MRVECYSGYRAEERPLRFTLGDLMHEVLAVEGQWYSPGVSWFRVRADDGNVYVLRHDDAQDVWTLDAYRAGAASGS
jgi:anti-sigma factor ChrR (cupin superfamily)